MKTKLTKQELILANERLSQLVAQYTTEVAAAHQKIQQEKERHRQLGETLGRHRHDLQVIVDSMPVMLFFKDAHNRILCANRAASDALGVEPDDMANTETAKWYPDEADQYYQDDLRVILSGRPNRNIVEQLTVGDNEKRWIHTDKIPYRDSSGKIIGVVVFVRDITNQRRSEDALKQAHQDLETRVGQRTAELLASNQELCREVEDRKKAEKDLIASRARYRSLYNNTPVMMHSIDHEGRIISVNDHWLQSLGYKRVEVLGRPSTDFLTEESRRLAIDVILPEFFRQGDVQDIEYQMVKKNGQVIDVLLSAVSDRDEAGQNMHSLAIIVDVTDRNRAVESARKHQEELALMARRNTVGELASGLAHDINQPLTAISNYAQCCVMKLSGGDVDAKHLGGVLTQITQQCDRAAQIIRRLRHFVSKGELRCSKADMNHLVCEAIVLLQPQAKSDRIEIQLDLFDQDLVVEVDEIQIQQAIFNIATNAVEAMADRDLETRRLIVRTARSNNQMVQVTLEDTGPGLSDDVAKHMFDSFYSTKSNGMGMGLAISRSIVESHGGKITVESNEREGSVFQFRLPLVCEP